MPLTVYKYFTETAHAELFLAGSVRITTLSYCRSCEDPARADENEAIHVYNTGTITGDSDNLALVERARRAGIKIGAGVKGVVLSNNIGEQVLKDAYVLCTTEEPGATHFGAYCVEIQNPSNLLDPLTRAIEAHAAGVRGHFGRVIYTSRRTTEDEPEPGPLGFVKPADRFGHEKEVRYLWTVQHVEGTLQPIVVDCAEVARYSRRVA